MFDTFKYEATCKERFELSIKEGRIKYTQLIGKLPSAIFIKFSLAIALKKKAAPKKRGTKYELKKYRRF
jgi:hypothetical protein